MADYVTLRSYNNQDFKNCSDNFYITYEFINLKELQNEISKSTACFSNFVIGCVVQNKTDYLKSLPNVKDLCDFINSEDGNTLLHIAIIYLKLEPFHFLLSLSEFPINATNDLGETPLMLAVRAPASFSDEVATALVKTGASLENLQFDEYDNLLHYAIDKPLVELSKLLMKMGFDLNCENTLGLTPIWACLDSGHEDRIETEIVTALLFYGADPLLGTVYGYNTFEYAVKFCSYPIEEALFYYIFDSFTSLDIHFEVLLTLADEKSPFFYETVKYTRSVILGRSSCSYYHLLFLIDVDYLRVLIEKCGDTIRRIFAEVTPSDCRMCSFCDKMSLSNFDLLLNSHLRDDTINFIVNFSQKFYFYILIGFSSEEEAYLIESVCYLLSYGLVLTESNLQAFYKRFGYGNLLKILLHMEIEAPMSRTFVEDAFLCLLYDVTMDLDKFLATFDQYSIQSIRKVLRYFSHPRLRELCKKNGIDVLEQPKVPLLTELARNQFRKYFVEVFKIKKCKEFYGLLNGLPISWVYKKIIVYETQLY